MLILWIVGIGVLLASIQPLVVAFRKFQRRRLFKLEPLTNYGDLFTLAEYREALKIYAMESDNGSGYWASADGLWVEKASDRQMRVDPRAIRAGGTPPETFFTHVMYYGK